MTMNKRFTLSKCDVCTSRVDFDGVIDNNTNELLQRFTQFSDKLNQLNDEIDVLKVTNGEMEDYLANLEKENMELNSMKEFAENHGINIFHIETAFRNCWNDNAKLVKENEELNDYISILESKMEECNLKLTPNDF